MSSADDEPGLCMLRHRNEFPVEGQLPAFDGATAWLNGAALTPAALSGRVVLVSFGTYTCINWIRSLPYVRAWADKYAGHGLVVVGVQTPEFEFEGDLDNVRPRHQGDGRPLPGGGRQRLRRLAGVRQPLLAGPVLRRRPGSDPAPPLRRGRVRGSEMVLQMLLREAGADVDQGLVRIEPDGVEAAADWASLGSPESYVGYERAVGLRLARRRRARRAPRLLGAGRAAPQPVGAVGRLADRRRAGAARRARRFHLVPVPRP